MRNTTANGESCGSGLIVPASSPRPDLVTARLWNETPTISCGPLSHFVDPEYCFLPSLLNRSTFCRRNVIRFSRQTITSIAVFPGDCQERRFPSNQADELLMTARALQKHGFIIESTLKKFTHQNREVRDVSYQQNRAQAG